MTDASSKEQAKHPVNLWSLPKVLSIKAVRVRYKKPKVYSVGRKTREAPEAVELLVQTSGPLPVRALSPALFVGDLVLTDYEPAGDNLYRFYAFAPADLKQGAPISFGWPQFPDRLVKTAFRYKVTGEEEK
jgi:hypothetical protein